MAQQKKIHHGKFLEDVMERSGKTMTEIIDSSGYARSTIYRWMKSEIVDMAKVHEVVIATGVNVKGELPALDYYREQLPEETKPPKFDRYSDNVSKGKYLEVLEQLNEVRSELHDVQSRYMKELERNKELEKRYTTGTKDSKNEQSQNG